MIKNVNIKRRRDKHINEIVTVVTDIILSQRNSRIITETYTSRIQFDKYFLI